MKEGSLGYPIISSKFFASFCSNSGEINLVWYLVHVREQEGILQQNGSAFVSPGRVRRKDFFCSVVADRTTNLTEEDVAVMTLQEADIRNLCSALEYISIYYTLSHVGKFPFLFLDT